MMNHIGGVIIKTNNNVPVIVNIDYIKNLVDNFYINSLNVTDGDILLNIKNYLKQNINSKATDLVNNYIIIPNQFWLIIKLIYTNISNILDRIFLDRGELIPLSKYCSLLLKGGNIMKLIADNFFDTLRKTYPITEPDLDTDFDFYDFDENLEGDVDEDVDEDFDENLDEYFKHKQIESGLKGDGTKKSPKYNNELKSIRSIWNYINKDEFFKVKKVIYQKLVDRTVASNVNVNRSSYSRIQTGSGLEKLSNFQAILHNYFRRSDIDLTLMINYEDELFETSEFNSVLLDAIEIFKVEVIRLFDSYKHLPSFILKLREFTHYTIQLESRRTCVNFNATIDEFYEIIKTIIIGNPNYVSTNVVHKQLLRNALAKIDKFRIISLGIKYKPPTPNIIIKPIDNLPPREYNQLPNQVEHPEYINNLAYLLLEETLEPETDDEDEDYIPEQSVGQPSLYEEPVTDDSYNLNIDYILQPNSYDTNIYWQNNEKLTFLASKNIELQGLFSAESKGLIKNQVSDFCLLRLLYGMNDTIGLNGKIPCKIRGELIDLTICYPDDYFRKHFYANESGNKHEYQLGLGGSSDSSFTFNSYSITYIINELYDIIFGIQSENLDILNTTKFEKRLYRLFLLISINLLNKYGKIAVLTCLERLYIHIDTIPSLQYFKDNPQLSIRTYPSLTRQVSNVYFHMINTYFKLELEPGPPNYKTILLDSNYKTILLDSFGIFYGKLFILYSRFTDINSPDIIRFDKFLNKSLISFLNLLIILLQDIIEKDNTNSILIPNIYKYLT